MAQNFDTLSIQITASATKAINQVNKLADALGKLNDALHGVDSSNLGKVTDAANSMGESIKVLRGSARTVKAVANNLAQIGAASGNVAEVADSTEALASAANDASKATKEAAQSAGGNGSSNFQRFTGILKTAGSALSKIASHASKAASGLKRVHKSSKSTATSAKGLAKELLRVSKMMKLMITRMILRKIITGIGDGFKNLAQYSAQVNASISLLWNSFRQLSNSIAAAVSPLLNAFAPALNYLIQLVIQAVNAINQLISAMMGLGTWTRAKTLTDDYAKSLQKAGGAAKELKKTVLGFDELNQLQDNKNSGGGTTSPANMFEEVEVGSKWKKLAEDLLKPIKEAWNRVGDQVVKAWKKAMQRVKKLGKDVARDFLKMWDEEETTKVFENLFLIIKDIGDFVGNLANSFDEAWNKNQVGLRIFEKLRDLVGIVVSGIRDMTKSWAEWADEVDFSPLLESIATLLEKLKKPAEFLMGVFDDINEHFIQPVAKWLIEEGLPKLTDAFSNFIDKVDWDTLRERIDRVATALAPFAKTVGEGLVKFIGDVGDKIANFLNSDTWDAFIDTLIKWMENVDAEDVANGLELIATALIAYKAFTWLSAIASGLATFISVFTGGNIATAAGGMITLADAITYFAGAIGGLAVGSAVVDKLGFPAWQGTIDGMIALGEALGRDTTELEVAKAKLDYMSEEYSGIGGKIRLVKDAITGDLAKLSYTVKDENGEIIGSYTASGEAVITFGESTAQVQQKLGKESAKMREWMDRTGQSAKKASDDGSKAAMDWQYQAEKSTYTIREAYAGVAHDIPVELQTLEKSQTEYTDTIKKSFSKENWTFSGVAEGLQSTFESAKSAVKGVWNSIADSLNGTFTVGSHSFTIGLPKLYANGGFPSQGSMFIAGESGAELVGNINGRTAVANNDQITTGIANAVYAAMVSAGGSGSTRYINNTIQIDGKTIARAVTVGQDKLNRLYSPTMA